MYSQSVVPAVRLKVPITISEYYGPESGQIRSASGQIVVETNPEVDRTHVAIHLEGEPYSFMKAILTSLLRGMDMVNITVGIEDIELSGRE